MGHIDYLNRFCKELPTVHNRNVGEVFPVRQLVNVPTFILLAEPGMGKTSVLRALAEESGLTCVTAAQIVSSARSPQGYQLFIDAFDEARNINDLSLLSTINQVVKQNALNMLGISCRIADWHNNYLENLTDHIPSPRIFELLPLSLEQQISVLTQEDYGYIKCPQDFIKQAQTKGFHELLGNPQTLMLLAKSVKSSAGEFPDSKNQAYDLACKQLLREHNHVHDAQLSSEIVRWQAAGWLASIALLADSPLISTTLNIPSEINESQVTNLSQLELPAHQSQNGFNREVLLEILRSRMFRSDNGLYSFTHRSVAEYMAAQYLANELQVGNLSPNRLASVMLFQGFLINNLRGLAGVLASLNPEMKAYLFQADPAAVIDYGDLTLLTISDKEELIEIFASHEQTDYQWGRWSNSAQYQPLADGSMQDFISQWLCERLICNSDNDKKYIVAEVLLSAILSQPKSEYWSALLAQLIQNPEIPPVTRQRAVKVWLVHEGDSEKRANMINWVYQNQQYDPEKEMLGRLLENLYPDVISPEEVLDYWSAPNEHYIGAFLMFWNHSLERKTLDDSLLPLLKSFENKVNNGIYIKDSNSPYQIFDYHSVPRDFSKIVIRAIVSFGESVDIEVLSTWLGWFDQCLPVNHKENQNQLDLWKQQHVEQVLKVVEYRLRKNNGMRLALWKLSEGWCIPDKEMVAFWLKQCAQLIIEDLIDPAQVCLNQAFFLLEKNHDEMLFQQIEHLANQHPNLKKGLEYLTVSPLEDNWRRENYHHEKEYDRYRVMREASEAQELETLLNDLAGVKEGRYLNYLHDSAWLDMSEDGYLGGDEILKRWQEKYSELKEATHEGYQSLLKKRVRECSIRDIVNIHVNNQISVLELPCRVAARELYTSNADEFWALGEEPLCTVLAFEFMGHASSSEWVKAIALYQPDWFVQTWKEVALQCLASPGKIKIPYLNRFSADEEISSLIMQTLPDILYSWPNHGEDSDIAVYIQLLMTLVYDSARAQEVSSAIEKCLSSGVRCSWQKFCLLLAGLWVDADRFILDLEEHLSHNQNDYRYFLEFIDGFEYLREEESKKFPKWSVCVIRKFILWTANFCSAQIIRGPVRDSSSADHMRRFLFKLINSHLLQTFTNEAHEIIVELAASKTIGDWSDHVAQLLPQYTLALANHRYQTPTPSSIAGLLSNKAPANLNDFIATIMNALDQLQVEVRNNPTNLKHRFWEVDRYSKPINKHKPENECRNVIADWLIPRVSNQTINLSPESARGGGNRTDIDLRVHLLNATEMVLPIEVKGDWNNELWSAPKEQLYQKYSTDLRCVGYGIYLVLWSGNLQQNLTPDRREIKSSEQLLQALSEVIRQDCNLQNIRVYVLDISHL